MAYPIYSANSTAPSLKRARTHAPTCGEVSEINIKVRAISGTVLQSMRIQRELLGQHLLDLVLQQQPLAGAGVAKLYHGATRVALSTPLGEQCAADSAEFTLVWVTVPREDRSGSRGCKNAKRSAYSGRR